MSRGQQGIGISAAGMYGMLTTGKPVKIISKVSIRKPAHYYEIQIDTKKNVPEI
jgi:DNA topoisomerase VI subunit B